MNFKTKKNTQNLSVAIKAGDEKGFALLFELYYQKLYLFALKLSANNEKAQDLVQEAITSLWEKRSKIDVDKPLLSYICAIIKNNYYTQYQKEKRNYDLIDSLKHEAINELIEDETHTQQQLAQIATEVEKLPKKSKNIFNLNKKSGLTYKEISDFLGLSEKTVESHIYRSMKKIKAGLE